MSCFVGFGGAFMAAFTPVTVVSGLHSAAGQLFIVAPMFVNASWFVAASGAGRSSSGRFHAFLGRRQLRDWANPTLPLGPGVRALTEALAGLGVMVIWQVLLVVTAPLSQPFNPIRLDDSFPGWLAGAAATWYAIVPGAMAWLLPARNQVIFVLRGLTATVLAAAILVISLNSVPLSLVFAAALVAALLGTARVAMIPGPFARSSRSSGRAAMFREPRAPLAQLRRDACLGPLRAGKWAFILSAACFALAIALSRAHAGAEPVVGFLGMIPPTLVGFTVAWYPLGTGAVARGHGSSAGLFNPDMGLAWTSLPLRREWVMRAFYVHATIAGLTFVALNLLGVKMTGGPAFFPAAVNGETIDWIAFLFAVPPFAGFLTCRAAGDHVRGAISLASLLLTGFGLPFLLIADREAAFALTALLAVAGGAPPLVHLFEGRSRKDADRANG